MDLKDYIIGEPTLTLVKGEPGTGKTILAASYPKPIYILSLDRKVGSIPGFYKDTVGITFDLFSDFWSTCLKLDELYDDCPYKTVVIDTLTTLSRFAINHSIKYRPEERAEDKKKQYGRKRGELMLPEVEDFGCEATGLNKVIDRLKEINIKWRVNVIMTAHVVTVENPMKKTISRVLVTGAKRIAAEIPGNFDEIYHIDIQRPMVVGEGNNAYIVKTRGDGEDFARTALPLPSEIDFTNKNFYSILQGYLQKGEDKNE